MSTGTLRTFGTLPKTASDTLAAKAEKPKRNRRRLLWRLLVGIVLLPFVLVAIALVLLYVPTVQNAVRGKAVSMLSEKLGTRVELDRFHLRFPLGVRLEGLYVEDLRGDTLLYAGHVGARAGLLKLIGGKLLLYPVELSDVRATLRQAPDSSFNFDFIIDAFSSADPDTTVLAADTTGGLSFAMNAVHLERVHFDMHLEPSELSLDVHLGELALEFDRFTLDPLAFHVDEFALKDTRVDLRSSSGEPTPPSYPALENPMADLDVRFGSMALENVAFTMTTTDTGDSLWIALNEAELVTRTIDLTRQQLALERFMVEGFDFGMLAMTAGFVPDSSTTPPLWLDRNDGFRFWTQDWDLAIDDLEMTDARFALHTDSISEPALLFDASHLVFTDMDLQAQDVALNNSRIAIDLENLSAKGGPENTLVSLALELDAGPDTMTVRDGIIKAMDNEVQFDLAAMPGNLSSAYREPYEVPVRLEAETRLQMAELLPLLQQLGMPLPPDAGTTERWDTRIWLTGTPRRADRMGLKLTGDQGTRIALEGRTRQADRWPHNTFDLKLDELIMGKGLRAVVRAYTPSDIPLPQRLTARGTMSGESGTVRSVIALDSDMGRITGFAVVNDWSGAVPDRVDLALTAEGLQVGRFIGDSLLAPVSFKVVADGEQLNAPQRSGTLTFTPTVLTYAGNDLSSLSLYASAHGDSLNVDLNSKAEAVDVTLHVNGKWPEPGDSIAMDLDLMVRKLHLNDLRFTEHVLNTDGRITGRLAFTPEAYGTVDLDAPGLRIFNDEQQFVFDEFALHGLLAADSTAVDLDCDIMHLAYHANLGMDSTLQLINDRLLGAFQEPYAFVPPSGRRIDLKLDLPGTARLASLIDPALKGMEVERFEGHYDSDSDVLALYVDVPSLDYAGIKVDGLHLVLDATGPELDGKLEVMRVQRDSLSLDELVLEATNVPGALRTLLRLRDGDVDRYRIGLDLSRNGEIPVIHIEDGLVLDRQDWHADSSNALYLDPAGLRAEAMVLSSGEQRLELRTAPDGNHLDLAGFELSTITGLIRSEDSLALVRGTLDATVLLPLHANELLKGEARMTALEVMGVPFGELHMRLEEGSRNRYEGDLSLEAEKNLLHADLVADLSGKDTRILVNCDLDLDDLGMFMPVANEYLFELGGSLTGKLRFEQVGDQVAVMGRTVIHDGRIGLVQTGAVYRIPQDTVVFDEQGLDLKGFDILDAASNRFRLDGRVNTAVGRTPELDLRLRTDRFLLVNSTEKDNPMFYGKLFGSIDLRIAGTALTPKVRGNVGILDSTDLSVVLPGSKVELIDHEGIVQFTADFDAQDTLAIKSDGELLRDSLAAQLPGVELDLRIALHERARFAIVIDPTTGDAATFSGKADLVFRYDPEGDIYLQGPFTVGKGGYTLEFYGLVKKRFDLVPGGTIIWDGDPLAGRMDIQAKYSTTVAPYPLVANARGGITESERNTLQAPLPFDVLINIRDAVEAPNISFGLDMDRQVRNSYPQVNSALDQLGKPSNQEELNRQVFGLLVLSTFIENESATEQGGSSLASTAARNSVNGILTQQLNRLTGQRIKGMDIQLGVNTYDQTQGGESYSRTTVDYKVTQRVLNDRVSFEAGGSVGYNERKQDVSAMSNTKAPQYAIAYDITKDGRLRLRAYHENAYDLYDGELVNNGVAIMLTRDFEKKEREQERQAAIRKRQEERDNDETP